MNDKQAEYVTDILESGRHLLSLINDILDLTKIEAGKMELYPSEIYLPELVQSTVTLMSETASRHALTLDIEMDDSVQMMTGDERKIKQVLFNLVSNAIKFTPDGGKIVIRVQQDERGTTFSVKDNGIGIEEEHLDSIFTEFKQVDSSLTRRFEGVGLGLAIVKRFHRIAWWNHSSEKPNRRRFAVFSFSFLWKSRKKPNKIEVKPWFWDSRPDLAVRERLLLDAS